MYHSQISYTSLRRALSGRRSITPARTWQDIARELTQETGCAKFTQLVEELNHALLNQEVFTHGIIHAA